MRIKPFGKEYHRQKCKFLLIDDNLMVMTGIELPDLPIQFNGYPLFKMTSLLILHAISKMDF